MGLNNVSPVHEQIPLSSPNTQDTMGSTPLPNRLRRFGVLIWKNTVLVRKRHWVLTLLEIFVPLMLFTIMAIIRANSSELGYPAVLHPTWFEARDQLAITNRMDGAKEVHYAPENSFTRKLMDRTNLPNIIGHQSEIEIILHYSSVSNDSLRNFKYVCVVFEGEAADLVNDRVPKKLSYKLRFRDNFRTDSVFDAVTSGPDEWRLAPYDESGFLGLQLLINKAYIELARGHEENRLPKPLMDQFFLQEMPYPPYNDDRGYTLVIKTMLPIVSMLSFMILCTTVTKRVVEEKQSGAKELMKLMGMEKWAFWLSWLVDALIVRSLSILMIVFLLTTPFNDKVGAVLEETSRTLLFFVLVIYCTAAITFLFAISTLFSRPVLAMSVSFIVWFISFALPAQYVESNPMYFLKFLTMIFPNMGLFFTFNAVLDHEKRGAGAQWSNLHESGSGLSRDLSLLEVLFMFFFDIILYSVITWYISEVHPGEYGYKQPYSFFLSKSYWLGDREHSSTMEEAETPIQDSFEKQLVSNQDDENVGIMIRNLRKTYPGGLGRPPVNAVQGVSLDIYKGEITALLGHNGAGKTTTMSILTGMISPTSGSVRVMGHDLKTDLSVIRQSLGLCPQHNLLFGELTVHQHLIFFAKLKGKSHKQAMEEAEDLLITVRLESKKDAYVSELSGGMKRKLSLAIALIGGSEVIMLDEPTSGLDPEARREIWDLLLNLRKYRTILLSTHFMEEADVLGDTIAIMAKGAVECCGSSMYLKRRYGAGYHLNLLPKNNCDKSAVIKAVRDHLPHATLDLHGATDDDPNSARAGPLSFNLPASKADRFPALFDALERSKESLGLASIGVSVTTMEEVFLRVGEISCKKEPMHEVDLSQPDRNTSAIVEPKYNGWELFAEQIKTLLGKKFTITKRQWLYVLMQFAMPTLMMLCAVWSSYGALTIEVNNEPEFPISLRKYGSDSSLHVLFATDPDVRSLAKSYSSVVRDVAQPDEMSGNIYKQIIALGLDNLANYRSNYIAAARFNGSDNGNVKAIGLYGVDPLHASPISLDLISNAILKHRASSAYQIETSNHPLPLDSPGDHINSYFTLAAAISVIWLTIAHIGWIFTTGITLVLPLQERVIGCRQQQLMAGCPLPLIWFSYLLIDICLTTLVSLVVLVVIYPFDHLHMFTSGNEFGVLFFLFFMYGLAGTAFSYFVSYLKDSVPSAFGFMVFFGIFVGGTVNMIVYTFELFPNWAEWGTSLRAIFGLFIPHSALISGLTHFSGTAVFNSVCRNIPPKVKDFTCSQGLNAALYPISKCCENICHKLGNCFEPLPYLSLSGNPESLDWIEAHGPIGRELLFLLFGATLWLGLVLLLDSGMLGFITEAVLSFVNTRFHTKKHFGDEVDNAAPTESIDPDVQKEIEAVNAYVKKLEEPTPGIQADGCISLQTQPSTRTIFAVDCLKKQYGVPFTKGRFQAVNGVSFRVQEGECFGLLGVNGAGKSSTFRMLTGAAAPTEGNAILKGTSLRRNKRGFLSSLGYCPQTDAHLGILTGRETLQHYAKLRGVKLENIDQEVDKWLTTLGLTAYADRMTSTYSGGNQRKLSAAMALIGEPPVALLDEPTSGVDPIARRQLWQALKTCQSAGQSIVLTSHSMDECEALCSRLGIMVDGQLVCVGPIGELKEKYGQGYTLMVKVKSSSWGDGPQCWVQAGKELDNLKVQIKNKFNNFVLMDEHQGLLHYQIKDVGLKWSELFKTMEELKAVPGSVIEDYTLSETTLEQVFLSFARLRDRPAVKRTTEAPKPTEV